MSITPVPLRAGLAVAVALLGGAGCAPAEQTPAGPQPGTSAQAGTTAPAAPISAPRTLKWIDLQAGDCLAGHPPSDPAEVMVTVVDCATPHLAEAYLRAEIPVDTALTDTASARCEAGFTGYGGRSAAASGLTISYLIDSEQDRTDNNPLPSTIICLVQTATGEPLTASTRRG